MIISDYGESVRTVPGAPKVLVSTTPSSCPTVSQDGTTCHTPNADTVVSQKSHEFMSTTELLQKAIWKAEVAVLMRDISEMSC